MSPAVWAASTVDHTDWSRSWDCRTWWGGSWASTSGVIGLRSGQCGKDSLHMGWSFNPLVSDYRGR